MYVLDAVSGDVPIKCESTWQQEQLPEVIQPSPSSSSGVSSSSEHSCFFWDQQQPQFPVISISSSSSSIWSPVTCSAMHQSHHEARTYAPLYPHPHHSQGNLFMDDGGLAPPSFTDLSKATLSSSHFMKPDFTYHHHPSSHHPDMSPHAGQGMGVQLPLHGFAAPSDVMLDQLQMQGMSIPQLTALTPLGDYNAGHGQHPLHASSLSSQAAGMAPMYGQMYSSSPSVSSLHHHSSSLPMMLGTHAAVAAAAAAGAMRVVGAGAGGTGGGQPAPQRPPDEADYDPQELEAFAEHFKQRRIKLGSTQADVGKALGNLKLPGVGSLSQSTICRFESLTLSHNNMVALRPVLETWLDDAERAYRDSKFASDVAAQSAMMGGCIGGSGGGGSGGGSLGGSLAASAADRKRKRTSIATPEKRSLEAYFSVQPRPSGEKIAQIADKLDLKKNVVRVWFCNQRQKQKRMKFVTPPGPGVKGGLGHSPH